MEAGADIQQSGETVVSESEAQHITLAQVNFYQHFKCNHTHICVASLQHCIV